MNFASSKKPTIRRTTVQVPVTTKSAPSHAQGNGVSAPARPRDPNRFKPTPRPGSKPSVSKHTPQTVRRALAPSRGVKRKSSTPDVHFSSDEDDNDSSDIGGSDSDASRKRVKSSVSSVESCVRAPRKLVSDKAFQTDPEPLQYIQGADATTNEHAAKFRNAYDADIFETVDLQYPSRHSREWFELKWPISKDDYKPMEDILNTIETTVTFYFPNELSNHYLGVDGLVQDLRSAFARGDLSKWLISLKEFNSVLHGLVEEGTIKRELERQHGLHLDWVKRILDQVYVRTVSPKAETLNAYKSGTDNVYGELLPRLVTDIFKKTGLTHEQTFIDLGSGVGNVVLQAALEIGCESWGIEMMQNPCDLAELQAKEFAARSQLWGLNVGAVNLLRGDMTKNAEIPRILQRADVVLVNNQAFTPALNDRLRDMFLDLKVGAQVVSLKPFVPEGHKIAVRNIDSIANQFVQRKFEYFSDCVSWSHTGNGHWYIATKDLRPLNAFRRKMGLD